MAESIREIANQLSGIFRHMLPGLLVIGAARVAYPSWFTAIDLSKQWHIAVLAALAVAVGNVWYVFHRYSIHQFIDWVFFHFQDHHNAGYLAWLSRFIDGSFRFAKDRPELHNHLRFRSSQVILMFIVSEILFVFTCCHEPKSCFAKSCSYTLPASISMFLVALIQYYISRTLDIQAVTPWQQKTTTTN